MPYEIRMLEHVGLNARQVIVTCRHGETVRIFAPVRGQWRRGNRNLIVETYQEHGTTYQSGCAERELQRAEERNRNRRIATNGVERR